MLDVHGWDESSSGLTVAEQLVLLSLDVPRRRVRDVVALAGGDGYQNVVGRLQQAGLLARSGVRRRLVATSAARVPWRGERLLAVIRDSTPLGDDHAVLLVLLAACGALRLRRGDHLRARHRIASIGSAGAVPSAVAAVCQRREVSDTEQLADVLLPPQASFAPGGFDPGISQGVFSGGGGGGGGPGC